MAQQLIRSFGLFWERAEVEWTPGRGTRRVMLGRRNKNNPSLRVANVWDQRGLYVLYSNTGPYYVGIATSRALGLRLAEHTRDEHKKHWARFSWFGFAPFTDRAGVLNSPVEKANARGSDLPVDHAIRDMEALLISAMGTRNLNRMNFQAATEWTQIWHSEQEHFLGKLDG